MTNDKKKQTNLTKDEKRTNLNEGEVRKSFNPNVKPDVQSSTPQVNPKTIPKKTK